MYKIIFSYVLACNVPSNSKTFADREQSLLSAPVCPPLRFRIEILTFKLSMMCDFMLFCCVLFCYTTHRHHFTRTNKQKQITDLKLLFRDSVFRCCLSVRILKKRSCHFFIAFNVKYIVYLCMCIVHRHFINILLTITTSSGVVVAYSR